MGLNIKPKTVKQLKEKTQEKNVCDLVLGKDFLDVMLINGYISLSR